MTNKHKTVYETVNDRVIPGCHLTNEYDQNYYIVFKDKTYVSSHVLKVDKQYVKIPLTFESERDARAYWIINALQLKKKGHPRFIKLATRPYPGLFEFLEDSGVKPYNSDNFNLSTGHQFIELMSQALTHEYNNNKASKISTNNLQ